MFPNKEVEEFLKRLRFRLSDWFEVDLVVKDGEFASTQSADTDMPRSICFCEKLRYVDLIKSNPSATCVIATEELCDNFTDRFGIVISKHPRLDFSLLHNTLAKKDFIKPVITPCVKNTSEIHPTAFVEDHCYIGKNVRVGPGAKILNNSYIEDGTIIGPNVVIGSEGLEFRRQSDNRLLKITHVGGVYLGPEVEIMANSVVCKDVYFGYTKVGAGTKIGPLCDIGHRSKIGENCYIAGNTTVAGSAKIGNSVCLGPSTTISSEVCVGNNARVYLGSVVVKDVKPGQQVSGLFAMDHSKALREYAFSTLKGRSR